jgi:hypothetical protein
MLLLMQLNVYILRGDMCVSFRYAACTCYERSVELVLFYVWQMGCACFYLILNSCNVSTIRLYMYSQFLTLLTDSR